MGTWTSLLHPPQQFLKNINWVEQKSFKALPDLSTCRKKTQLFAQRKIVPKSKLTIKENVKSIAAAYKQVYSGSKYDF